MKLLRGVLKPNKWMKKRRGTVGHLTTSQPSQRFRDILIILFVLTFFGGFLALSHVVHPLVSRGGKSSILQRSLSIYRFYFI